MPADPDARYRRRLVRGIHRPTLGPNWTHGRRSTYSAGCGCDPCTDAEATYAASRPPRRVAPERWPMTCAGAELGCANLVLPNAGPGRPRMWCHYRCKHRVAFYRRRARAA